MAIWSIMIDMTVAAVTVDEKMKNEATNEVVVVVDVVVKELFHAEVVGVDSSSSSHSVK